MAELHTMRDVLTVDEIADYLRVSRATICRWCGTGKLPAFKIGKSWRVQRNDLEVYIRYQRGGSQVLLRGVQSSEENFG